MDYLHRVLPKYNYTNWMINESGKKPENPILNLDTGLKVKKISSSLSPLVPGINDKFRRIF